MRIEPSTLSGRDPEAARVVRAFFDERRGARRLDRVWRVLACAKQVARYGASVRRAEGMSLGRQFAGVLAFTAARRAWPEPWYLFELYRPERAARVDDFVFQYEASPLQWHLNQGPDLAVINDKQSFAAACAQRGVPAIPTVAYFEKGRLVEPAALSAGDLPREDLFVKLTNARCGEGAERWAWRGDATYERHDGQRLGAAALVERLARASRGRPHVVQRRVSNHPAVAPWSAGGLCTIRVVTGRKPGADPALLAAVIRMPTAHSHVDNFSTGGVAAPVDAATGRLGPAVSHDPRVRPVTAHPDTGRPIAGAVLPFWPEAVAAGVAAHRAFPSLAAVGWDVALTPAGPVLVEANPVWGVEIMQMAHGRPLADFGFFELAAAHLTKDARPAQAATNQTPPAHNRAELAPALVRR